MIEVYRDRLKLDVMVVNAFNQILSIQPNNFEAADALAAQYETMKRWPDLIALLRKKAAVRRDRRRTRSRCTCGSPNLFLEKFSNQAEAIKAFEKILELDPDNREALEHLLSGLREAPRLGEADRAQRSARSSARRTRERAAKVDRGRAAWPRRR